MAGGYNFNLFDQRLTGTFSTVTKSSTPDFHLHNTYEMYFLVEGNVTFLIEDRRSLLQSGDLVLLNNHEVHKSINPSEKPYSRYVVHFDPTLLSGFTFDAEDGESVLLAAFHRAEKEASVLHISNEDIPKVKAQFDAIIQALQDKSTNGFIRAQAHLVLLLCQLSPLPESASRQVRQDSLSTKVIAYLQDHLTDDFSLNELSDLLRVNKNYLCRRFKTETGGTIYHYLMLKRIVAAQMVLMNGGSVQEACDQSGFSDYANFIRSFKKQTGIAPGQYQKRFGR